MKKPLRVLELFAGIGAPRKALQRGGYNFTIVDTVEIDPNPVKSYNAIYNDNVQPQDISKWDASKLGLSKGDVDLIWNSSPCQDISLAGKNKGAEEGSGTRSSLIYEVIRISKDLMPKMIVWENVKGLTTKKHKHILDDYIERLKELGYTSYWKVLNAKEHGVPQNRERVFVVSILGEHEPFVFPEKQELKTKLRDILEDEVEPKYYLNEDKVKRIISWKSQGRPLARVKGLDDVVPTITARSQGDDHGQTILVSNNKDTLNIEKIICEERCDEGLRFFKDNVCGTIRTINAGGDKRVIELLEEKNGQLSFDFDSSKNNDNSYIEKKYKEFIDKNGYIPKIFNPYNTKEVNDVSNTITAACGSTTTSSTHLIVDDEVKIREYKNYFSWQDEKGRINTQDHRGFKDATISGTVPAMERGIPNVVLDSENFLNPDNYTIKIRKLIPLECWRLMGFDDIDFYRAKETGVADSQLYKQAGNSVVVNVIECIFDNLLKDYQ